MFGRQLTGVYWVYLGQITANFRLLYFRCFQSRVLSFSTAPLVKNTKEPENDQNLVVECGEMSEDQGEG